MSYCADCGEKISASVSFCGNCGFPVEKSDSKKVKNNHKKRKKDIGVIDTYIYTLQNYFNFNGRASRREYWIFYFLTILFFILLGMIESLFSSGYYSDESTLSGLFYLFSMIPSISIGIRRMHDRGKSGWWIFFPIVNLLLTLESGEVGDNQYGPEPVI